MRKQSIVRDLVTFLREEKKWWLIPPLLILLLIGTLLVFAGGSVLAPFIYPFF